nr:MAG TPA: hypothetical protein [Caudoviricetes sp.]
MSGKEYARNDSKLDRQVQPGEKLVPVNIVN